MAEGQRSGSPPVQCASELPSLQPSLTYLASFGPGELGSASLCNRRQNWKRKKGKMSSYLGPVVTQQARGRASITDCPMVLQLRP